MLAVISLTRGGAKQAKRVKKRIPEADCYAKFDLEDEDLLPFEKRFSELVTMCFENYSEIVFIMATGIVVRTIAPLLKHKSKDPAILVLDEKGQFIIPLVSGHLGGANQKAIELAKALQATPVITTASDVCGLKAVDELAKEKDLFLFDFDGAKQVTADLVNGKPVGLFSYDSFDSVFPSEYEKFEGKRGWVELEKKLLIGAIASFIIIGDEKIDSDYTYVQLYPRKYCFGIGCRRGIGMEKLEEEAIKILDQAGIAKEGVGVFGTAWVKADETGILTLANAWKAEIKIFQKEEILKIADRFIGSDFVQATIGVPCVSEPCGYLSAKGGRCMVPVQKNNGMTLSLWQRKEREI
jgi:cobalt-precorrin 5A hydrolase